MSPAGIGYALDRIAQVARGQTGAQAVNSIVTRFERPANPAGEIAGALAAYGSTGSGGAGAVPSPAAPAAAGQPPPDNRQALMQALLGASKSGDYSGFFGAVKASRQTQAAPQGQVATPAMTSPAGGYGGAPGQVVGATQGEQPSFLKALAALAGYTGKPISIRSGYRSPAEQAVLYANRASNPNPVAPPGRSLHQQGLAADGTIGGVPIGTLPPALLARFGLEGVPGDPVHVQVRR